MSTYQEVAENLIRLYAHYIEVCTESDMEYYDSADDLTIAVEALLIRANEEKQKAMLREYQSQLNSIAPIPQPSVNQWVEQGLNLSDYPAAIY